jgi:hypothetical protein
LRTSEQVSALVIKALRKYLKEALPLYRLSAIKGMARRANRRACSLLSPQGSLAFVADDLLTDLSNDDPEQSFTALYDRLLKPR